MGRGGPSISWLHLIENGRLLCRKANGWGGGERGKLKRKQTFTRRDSDALFRKKVTNDDQSRLSLRKLGRGAGGGTREAIIMGRSVGKSNL